MHPSIASQMLKKLARFTVWSESGKPTDGEAFLEAEACHQLHVAGRSHRSDCSETGSVPSFRRQISGSRVRQANHFQC